MQGYTNWTSVSDTFNDNVALTGSGGAVSSFGSHLRFDAATSCVRNLAPDGGGGCVLWEPNAINIEDENWKIFKPMINNSQLIIDNQASYGATLATPGASLRIVDKNAMTTGTDNLFQPRYPQVELLDWYGAVVHGAFAADIRVTSDLLNSEVIGFILLTPM